MLIKIITSLLAFTLAFLAATSLTNTFPYNFRSVDAYAQDAVYNFLNSDLKMRREMCEKIENSEMPNRVFILRDYHELRSKMDTSDLPEDFRDVWEKNILNEIEWAGFILHLKNFNKKGTIETNAEREIADQKIAESRFLESQLKAISKSYGVGFDDKGIPFKIK